MPSITLMAFAVLFSTSTVLGFNMVSPTFAPLGKPDESFTSTQGHSLALRRWAPSGSAKAKVVLQHGGGFHSGYFGQVGQQLSNAGYEVLAMDAMGHGYSEGPGGLTYWSKLSHVQDDLAMLVAEEKKKSPDLPIIALGESMGAMIIAPLGTRGNPNIDGLVFAGGLFQMAKETIPPAPIVFIMRILGRLMPEQKVTLPTLEASFDEAFGDQRWAEEARADPFVSTDSFYLGPAAENFAAMEEVRSAAKLVSSPLLVMHSKSDVRTDCDAAVKFFEGVSSADKQLKLYDDASHQLFQDSEANNARAIADLTAWLDARFA